MAKENEVPQTNDESTAVSDNNSTNEHVEQGSQEPLPQPLSPSRQSPPPRRGIGSRIGGFFSGIGFQFAKLRRFLFRGRIPDYPVILLDGELVERTPTMPWWQQLIPNRKPPMSLELLNEGLRKIALEPKTKGVILLFKSPAISLTQAQSLIMLFDRFRQWDAEQRNAGATPKQVIVHIEDGAAGTYVAACGADNIYMTPLTEFKVMGLRLGSLFVKDTLKKIGVEFDVVRIAPWKTAADMYDRTEMSPEARDQYNWLIEGLYNSIATTIHQRRGIGLDRVKALIDDAPLNADQALAADLIDGIYYEDELPDALSWGTKSAVLRPADDCVGIMLRQRTHRAAKSVGVISLSGAIMSGKSRDLPIPLPLFGSEQIGSATVQQLVRAAREDESLGAVVVHVDSPGGSALASDIMWRELTLLNKEKPVVIYMGNVAASGGYYISTPGQKIVAQPATITGSIGVITAKPSTKGLYDKLEANREFVQRGENADLYAEDSRWSGAQIQKVNDGIKHIYHEFKDRVAQGRSLPMDELDPICQGRVWTGEQALAHGLVDRLGDIHTAIEEACILAELPTGASVRVTNVDGPKEPLLAQPMQATEEALGFTSLHQMQTLLSSVVRGEWNELLGSDDYWLIADNLPQIK